MGIYKDIHTGKGGMAYIWEEKYFNLQSVKLITFLSRFCTGQQPQMVRMFI